MPVVAQSAWRKQQHTQPVHLWCMDQTSQPASPPASRPLAPTYSTARTLLCCASGGGGGRGRCGARRRAGQLRAGVQRCFQRRQRVGWQLQHISKSLHSTAQHSRHSRGPAAHQHTHSNEARCRCMCASRVCLTAGMLLLLLGCPAAHPATLPSIQPLRRPPSHLTSHSSTFPPTHIPTHPPT